MQTIADIISPVLHRRLEVTREENRRKQAEQALETKAEALERSNSMSYVLEYLLHELNNPMSALLSRLQLASASPWRGTSSTT